MKAAKKEMKAANENMKPTEKEMKVTRQTMSAAPSVKSLQINNTINTLVTKIEKD